MKRFLTAASITLTLFTATALAQPSPPNESESGAEAKSNASGDASFTIENSLNLRDPFSRLIMKGANKVADVQIPELERHDLQEFKLIGIITGPNKNRALVMGPDSKMHVVSESAVIGTRKGLITKIRPGGITVYEKVVNLLGQQEGIESKIEFQEKKPGG